MYLINCVFVFLFFTFASDGSTCLHEGAYSGSLKMVALLLSLGADGMKRVMTIT